MITHFGLSGLSRFGLAVLASYAFIYAVFTTIFQFSGALDLGNPVSTRSPTNKHVASTVLCSPQDKKLLFTGCEYRKQNILCSVSADTAMQDQSRMVKCLPAMMEMTVIFFGCSPVGCSKPYLMRISALHG